MCQTSGQWKRSTFNAIVITALMADFSRLLTSKKCLFMGKIALNGAYLFSLPTSTKAVKKN